jgi:hypothetical protein
MDANSLCVRCKGRVRPVEVVRGSLFIEVLLWALALIPGLLYHMWVSSTAHEICPECGSGDLVPLDSPRARQILKAPAT